MDNSVNKAYTKDDAERLLADVHNQIQHADNKASVLLTFLGIIVGLTLNAFLALKQVDFTHEITISVFVVAFFILYLLSLIASLIFEIIVLTARYDISKFKQYGIEKQVFYFGYIGKVGYKKFKADLENMSEEDILQEINSQIVVNSYIANKKYKFFNWALACSVAVLISAIAVAILTSVL